MIYITGDTHADFKRFSCENFPQMKTMTKDDYVIICGDFGGVWNTSDEQEEQLDRLEHLPFTLLFITGNHENYDLLETYPVQQWNGGKVQFIRPHVIHLMRSQVFTIDGKTFFTMGGAASHDIYNGVLDPKDPFFSIKYDLFQQQNVFFRVKGWSWWEQEVPTQQEYEEARKNLRKHNMRVDYIITHCAPNNIQKRLIRLLKNQSYPENDLTNFLQEISQKVKFKKWYFGHFHCAADFGKFRVLYTTIEELDNAPRNYKRKGNVNL